jgi:hypothetical protein
VVHPNVMIHPPSIGINCLIIQIMEITSDWQVLTPSLTLSHFASMGLHEFIHSNNKMINKCNPYPYSNLVYFGCNQCIIIGSKTVLGNFLSPNPNNKDTNGFGLQVCVRSCWYSPSST